MKLAGNRGLGGAGGTDRRADAGGAEDDRADRGGGDLLKLFDIEHGASPEPSDLFFRFGSGCQKDYKSRAKRAEWPKSVANAGGKEWRTPPPPPDSGAFYRKLGEAPAIIYMTKQLPNDTESLDRPALEITPQMIEVGVSVLRASGRLEHEGSDDHLLVRQILEAVLR